eukprot:jgi/Pico_ML_1/51392/g199.t1
MTGFLRGLAAAGTFLGMLATTWSRMVVPRNAAPAFKAKAVVNEKFVDLSLEDYRGKWLVLFFYPFDFTFVCPTEIVAFSEAMPQFHEIGAEVAAVSTDSHHTHLAWIKTPRELGGLGHLNLPLVADVSKRISSMYGVLVEDEEDELYGAALRGLFIVDPQQVVRSVQINDEAVGRSVDETLRLVKAFQYADKHGEGCPADWKPGAASVVPDPIKSKEFFTTWSTEHPDSSISV